MSQNEVCQNPWKHGDPCTNTDIKLYIQIVSHKRKGSEANQIPICDDCWGKIAKSDKEWGDAPRVYPTLGLTEEDMKNLTIMDTSNLGQRKSKKEQEKVEDEEIEY